MSAKGFAARYLEGSVNTSSPTKLVVMLYEGAIRFVKQAIIDIDEKNLQNKRVSIDRAMAIVQQLHTSLDMERGGEVAVELDRLYSYVTSRILEGSAKLDKRALNDAIRVLTTLNSAWTQLAGGNARNDAHQPPSYTRHHHIQAVRA